MELRHLRYFVAVAEECKLHTAQPLLRRPLLGEAPTIDLVIGYNRANPSPILASFLGKLPDMTRL